jgi:hypothetical protein
MESSRTSSLLPRRYPRPRHMVYHRALARHTSEIFCQPKSVLHVPSPEIHGETNGRIDATTHSYGISMQSCRTRLLRDNNTRVPRQPCMLRDISTPLSAPQFMFFLQCRITSLLQSKSTLLLSGSVALIGQSLVLHNCVIIDIFLVDKLENRRVDGLFLGYP